MQPAGAVTLADVGVSGGACQRPADTGAPAAVRVPARGVELLEDAVLKVSAVVSSILGVSGRAMVEALARRTRPAHP